MDSTRKRRGCMKGKLMPFYRSSANTKPSSAVQYTSKVVKPNQSSPTASSVGFLLQQDYVIAQPKPNKVSFVVPENTVHDRLIISQYDKIFGVAGDEGIDTKAASYISSARERFKLERNTSERKEFSKHAIEANS